MEVSLGFLRVFSLFLIRFSFGITSFWGYNFKIYEKPSASCSSYLEVHNFTCSSPVTGDVAESWCGRIGLVGIAWGCPFWDKGSELAINRERDDPPVELIFAIYYCAFGAKIKISVRFIAMKSLRSNPKSSLGDD